MIVKAIKSEKAKRVLLTFISGTIVRVTILALAIVVGRSYGPHGYGLFSFAISIGALAASVASLGLPNVFNRLSPQYILGSDWSKLRGLKTFSEYTITATCFLAAAVLVWLGAFAGSLAEGLAGAAFLVWPLSMSILRKQQLASFGRPALGSIFDQGFAAILLVFFLLVSPIQPNIRQTILIFSASGLVGVLIATRILNKCHYHRLKSVHPSYEWKNWLGLGLPILAGTAAKTVMARTDVLVLAPLAGLYEAGIYGAAYRLTYVMTFSQVVLMSVVTPLISEAFASGSLTKARSLLIQSMYFALVTTAPFVVILIIWPQHVLSLVFGEEFGGGAHVLVILSIAQFFASFTNANGAVLMMGGEGTIFARINITAFIINLILCFMLVPIFQAVGAALATLVGYLFILVSQTIASNRLLKKQFTV